MKPCVTGKLYIDSDPELRDISKRVMAAMAAGELRCAACGAAAPLNGNVKAVEQYLFTTGWPVCCGATMGFYPPPDYLARISGKLVEHNFPPRSS